MAAESIFEGVQKYEMNEDYFIHIKMIDKNVLPSIRATTGGQYLFIEDLNDKGTLYRIIIWEFYPDNIQLRMIKKDGSETYIHIPWDQLITSENRRYFIYQFDINRVIHEYLEGIPEVVQNAAKKQTGKNLPNEIGHLISFHSHIRYPHYNKNKRSTTIKPYYHIIDKKLEEFESHVNLGGFHKCGALRKSRHNRQKKRKTQRRNGRGITSLRKGGSLRRTHKKQ